MCETAPKCEKFQIDFFFVSFLFPFSFCGDAPLRWGIFAFGCASRTRGPGARQNAQKNFENF